MAKMIALACVGLVAAGWVGCSDSDAKRAQSEPARSDSVGVTELDCGELIRRVLAREEFQNRDLVVTGVALSDSQGGLVNVGTSETFRSGSFENFVEVYDVTDQVKAGSTVRMMVRVESASARTLPGGKSVALIATVFRK